MSVKVIIADDQPLIREGIKYIIEQDNDIHVIGCVSDGFEAFKLCSRLSPDVVLMDIKMPGCDGIKGTKLIKSEFPNIKVLILTTFDDTESITGAINNGADGYILKDVDTGNLLLTIKGLSKGLNIIHNTAYTTLKNNITGERNDMAGTIKKNITQREIEIIQLIVYGNSNKEIAADLGITEGSVRNIISGILSKLSLADRTQLAVYSIKNKIV